jgi:uncharacterized membrane protein YtjA (UPF0391 family)
MGLLGSAIAAPEGAAFCNAMNGAGCQRRPTAGRADHLGARDRPRRKIRPIDSSSIGTHTMLRWALIFAVIAIVAGLLGFTGVAAGAAVVAKTLFYIFLGLVVVFVALGLTVARKL